MMKMRMRMRTRIAMTMAMKTRWDFFNKILCKALVRSNSWSEPATAGILMDFASEID